MTYAEKLKNPLWQRKRLEILQRDGFQCQECFKMDKTLHVHHKMYSYNKDLWEYDNNNYITLCEDCHSIEEKNKIEFNKTVHDILFMGGSYWELKSVLQPLAEYYIKYDEPQNSDGEKIH